MVRSPVDGLIQPYPSSALKFDYVDKWYADILDSVASIIIVWSASTLVSNVFHFLQGHTTKSVASKDIMDRLLYVSIAPLLSFRSISYTAFKPKLFVNVIPRLIGVIGFISILSIDALIIFSQSSFGRTRSLDSLQLRRISFQKPSSTPTGFSPWATGCFPLVRKKGLDRELPFRFCMSIINTRHDEFTFNRSNKVHIGMPNDKFIEILFPNDPFLIVTRFSVVMRDDVLSKTYFANLTKWSFSVSPSKLDWMVEIMNEIYPNCVFEIHASNSTFCNFFSIGDNCTLDSTGDIALLFHKMLRVSDDIVQTKDFFGEEGKSPAFKERLFSETAFETNKRLSGVILWIIALVLETIRILTGTFFWDITEEMDEMVTKILAKDGKVGEVGKDAKDAKDVKTSLQYCQNMTFEIVDLKEIDSELGAYQESDDSFPSGEKKLVLRRRIGERT